MAKSICPNGHIYDSSIYHDKCPLCPSTDSVAEDFTPGKTRINAPNNNVGGRTDGGAGLDAMQFAPNNMQHNHADPTGETLVKHQGNKTQPNTAQANVNKSNATMIRPPQGHGKTAGRKLVGFLVSYNRYPLGKAFPLYEGKNFIGRDADMDISIPDDTEISGRHMMILYRNIDHKFRYNDERSTNGTFVNKQPSDEGELENYDIIRLGNTVFTFIAIPQV